MGRLVKAVAGVGVAAATVGFAMSAGAGVLTGIVTGAGEQPLAGAMVTLRAPDRAESVYTNARGAYRLETTLSGALDLRVRKRYHHDLQRGLELAADASAQVDAVLEPLTDPKQLSDDHPSLSHFARIAFAKDEKAMFSRPNFTRDCLSCHSLGNAFTRTPRTAESWVPTVQRMHGYLGNADESLIRQRAEILARAFDGSLASSRPQIPADPLLASAKIREWPLPGSVVPHDAEYHESNGRIYISEMFAGEVIEADPGTNRIRHFRLPDDGMPPGGAFTKAGLPPPYGLTIARAPHSLAEGPDGRFYLTDSIGAAVTVFDPQTHAFENYDIGGGALYPHTVRVDARGVVWFTIAFTDQVGRFDPKTKDMRVINLPPTPSLSTPGTTIPYGIDVNPADGSIWYAKLASDKIGRIDATTLAVTEYDSPVQAPRRQRFDAAGYLWIAGFSDGTIARMNVATRESTIYRLPRYAPGEIPAPYALAIHPQTQDVWVNDTMLDVVWRFIPAEERFVAYPMPLKGTYTRDFTFTREGWACTTNNPIPAPALEGGVPELICIDTGPAAAAKVADRH